MYKASRGSAQLFLQKSAETQPVSPFFLLTLNQPFPSSRISTVSPFSKAPRILYSVPGPPRIRTSVPVIFPTLVSRKNFMPCLAAWSKNAPASVTASAARAAFFGSFTSAW